MLTAQFAQRLVLVPIAALLMLFTALGARAQEGERWALVVGIADYQSPRMLSLDNTINDARTMAASLTNMGFKVYLLENTTRAELDATVQRIGTEVPDAELGLFFYAGHGVQQNGVNYALPADIDPDLPDFLLNQGISISKLVGDMKGIGVGKLVVVLDSCRNSPFGGDQAFGIGLALVDAPVDTIVAYSTAPGAVALDGIGVNSPFTAALASALEGPRQDIRDVLRLVRARVRLATGGAQTPWFIDNSGTEIVVQPREEIAIAESLRAALSDTVSLASTAWETISTSSDPNDFNLFAELYPEHPLSQVAREQASLLRDAGQPVLPVMELGVPDPNPAVPGGLDSLLTACDLLATGPADPLGLVEPIPHDLVNTRAALRACIEAVTNDPENPRLLGLLARVLNLEERYDEALYYFTAAADNGSSSGFGGLAEAYRFGLGVPEDLARSAEYVRQGALLGNVSLRLQMGVYYREGWGVPQSFSEARRWLENAAGFGFPNALSALADLYRNGQGVPQDHAKALTYYRQAAAGGHTDAMNSVGMAYMRGEGVERDLAQGIYWLSRASEQGNPYSAHHLGRAFRTGWGVEKDPRQAIAYYRLSAQRNFMGAYTEIGDMLTGNDGIPADLPQAYASLTIAIEAAKLVDTTSARKNGEVATAKLDELRPRMTAEQITGGERIAAEWLDQYGVLDFARVWE